MLVHQNGRIHAPEFPQGIPWLQGGPLSMRELRGKVILIDFWTYSCVNCIRTIPHVKRWYEMYAKDGLVIVGVHTPEFAFEKIEGNVRHAVERFGITYPVVQDNDYTIWKRYANRSWPRKFLINKDGIIVYDHAGEGAYAATEIAIHEELRKMGVRELPAIGPDSSMGGRLCYRTTNETYFGFLRGKIENACDALPGEEVACTDDATMQDDGAATLHGHWKIHPEFVEHARTVSGTGEYIRLQYSAYAVNVVCEAPEGRTAKLEIFHNQQPIAKEMRGEDIEVDDRGRTWVTIADPRMYNLIQSKTYHQGSLRIGVSSEGVRMYAATYGSCASSV
jgi:thiol-disulfide isomerase/thioredoxin